MKSTKLLITISSILIFSFFTLKSTSAQVVNPCAGMTCPPPSACWLTGHSSAECIVETDISCKEDEDCFVLEGDYHKCFNYDHTCRLGIKGYNKKTNSGCNKTIDSICYTNIGTTNSDEECKKKIPVYVKGVKSINYFWDNKTQNCYLTKMAYEKYKASADDWIKIYNEIKPPSLEIKIPGLDFSSMSTTVDNEGYLYIPYIGQYLTATYKFAIVAISIVAVIMLVIIGAGIIVSGGGDKKVEGIKKIGKVFLGLVIAWGSYAILYNINPDLVQFKALKVKYVVHREIEVSPGSDTPSDGPSAPSAGSGKVPLFLQCTGPWAKIVPGESQWPLPTSQKGRTGCSTICRRGCGTTSLAMLLQYYGYNSVTPLDTAKWGLGCTGAWQPSKTIKNGQPLSSEWNNIYGKTINKKDVIKYLTEGKPIIYNGSPVIGLKKDKTEKKYGGHYVVLTGINNNIISVNDPGSKNGIVTMTVEQMQNNFNVAVYIYKQ